MRTALCISGRMPGREDAPSLKDYKQDNVESVRTNLIEPYGADVFIDTWNPHNDNGIDYLIREYQPKLINVEHHEDSAIVSRLMENLPSRVIDYSGRERPETSIPKLFKMWHKIYGCNQLRKRYEEQAGFKYDCVIRFRFELNVRQFPVITPEPNTCYIPEGADWGGVCDMIAVSDGDTMDKYCGAFLKVREYDRDGKPIHPESLVKYHLEQEHVIIKRFGADVLLRGMRVFPFPH